jgi:hypothetical protein
LDHIGINTLNTFWLRHCVLRSDDENAPEKYDTHDRRSEQFGTLKDVFGRIQMTKAVTLKCEKGDIYYFHPTLCLHLDFDIDKNLPVRSTELQEAANRLEKLFKETYNKMLSGKNDFEYRGRIFRFTGIALFELSQS